MKLVIAALGFNQEQQRHIAAALSAKMITLGKEGIIPPSGEIVFATGDDTKDNFKSILETLVTLGVTEENGPGKPSDKPIVPSHITQPPESKDFTIADFHETEDLALWEHNSEENCYLVSIEGRIWSGSAPSQGRSVFESLKGLANSLLTKSTQPH